MDKVRNLFPLQVTFRQQIIGEVMSTQGLGLPVGMAGNAGGCDLTKLPMTMY